MATSTSKDINSAIRGSYIDQTDGTTAQQVTVIGALPLSSYIDFTEITAPSTPDLLHGRLYIKDNGGNSALFFKDDLGNETQITSSGSGGATTLRALTDVDPALAYTSSYVLVADGSIYTGRQLDHLTDVLSVGTNTHAQIDTHIANTSNPHSTTAAQVGAPGLTTANLLTALNTFSLAPKTSATPSSDTDLTNKGYVDTLFGSGSRFVTSTNYATTAALPTCTYSNGTLGVGATLTGSANGALATQDGQSPSVTNVILVKNQVSLFQNGVYTVSQVGTAGTPFILTRITDYDQSSEVVAGTFFNVLAGTTNGNTQWAMNKAGTITMGTTDITFAQLSSPTVYTASLGVQKVGNDFQANYISNDGLKLTGNQLTVAYDNNTLGIVTNTLAIKSGGVTNTQISDVAASKVTGVLGETHGGTNQSVYVKGDMLYASAANTLSRRAIGSSGQVWTVQADGTANWSSISSTSGGTGVTAADFLPRPTTRKFFLLNASSSAMAAVGVAAGTISGTGTLSNDATSSWINYATTTVLAATAGYRSTTFDLVRRSHNPTFVAYIRTGSTIANMRIWAGLFSATPTNTDTLGVVKGFSFRYSSGVGATWYGVTSNGATQTATNTSAAIAINTIYLLKIVVDSGAGTATFTVNGASSTALSTNLPATTDELGYAVLGINTTAGTAKNLAISAIYTEFTNSPATIVTAAPTTSRYLLVSSDVGNLPSSQVIAAGSGLTPTDGGAGTTYTLSVDSTVARDTNTPLAMMLMGG